MRLEDVGPQRNLPDSAEPWGRYTDQKIRELQRQVQRLTGETKGVRQVVAAAADSADALVTDAKDTADQAQETGDIAYEEAANAAQEAVNAKETADLAIEDAAAAFREANAARQAAAEAWKQAANQTPNWSFEEGAVRWASNFGFNDTNISEVTDAVDGQYVARVTLGSSVRHELRTANDDAHRVEPDRIWDVVVRARVTSGSATIGVGAYVFNKSNSGFAYLVPTTESLIPADGWVTLRARIKTSDVTHEFIAPLITAQNVVGNVVEFDAVEFKDVTDAVLAQTIADAAAFQAAQALSKASDAQDSADDAQGTADQAVQDALAAKNRADQAHANAATAQSAADAAASDAAQAAGLASDAQDAADAAAADAIAKASAAETAAKAHADAQAAAAQAAAIAAASGDATDKAAAAQAAAEAAAATDALAKANAAQAAAEAKAEEARLLAAGKADVLIQPSAPVVAMRKATTLWIDTTNGANTPKRWSGSAWVTVTDKAATDAANAAANAKSAADAAQQAADNAQAAADAAQTTASAAQAAANAAQDRADQAHANAATAQAAADQAKSDAQAASQSASAAQSTADAAVSDAAAAQSRANQAANMGTVRDGDRDSDNPPHWYRANYPRQIVYEFKRRIDLNVPGSGAYGVLETNTVYGSENDTSGGPVQQIFTGPNGVPYYRTGATDSWTEWKDRAGDAQTAADQAAAEAADAQAAADAASARADAAQAAADAAQAAADAAQARADAAMDVATEAQTAAGIALDQAWARIRAGGNIIVNGDFEDGDIGWTFSTGQSVVVLSGARSGTHVLSAANLSGGKTVSEWYPANPNAVVEMSFSAYLTPTATTGIVSGLVEVLREGGLIDTIAVSDPGGTIPAATTAKSVWVSRTNEFLLPSDTVKVRAAISATTNGPVYVDDVLAYDVTSAVDARLVGEEALLGIDSAVVELTESFSSEVSQTSEQILSTVSDIYSAKTEMIEEIGLIQSQIDQQAENIDFRFIEVSESVIDLEGELQGYQSELATYIRFNNEGIELGKVGNPFITRLSNTELAFYEAGQKVAHISNNQLNITNATINNNLAMGTGGNGYFDWIPRENGNLSFKFRED